MIFKCKYNFVHSIGSHNVCTDWMYRYCGPDDGSMSRNMSPNF